MRRIHLPDLVVTVVVTALVVLMYCSCSSMPDGIDTAGERFMRSVTVSAWTYDTESSDTGLASRVTAAGGVGSQGLLQTSGSGEGYGLGVSIALGQWLAPQTQLVRIVNAAPVPALVWPGEGDPPPAAPACPGAAGEAGGDGQPCDELEAPSTVPSGAGGKADGKRKGEPDKRDPLEAVLSGERPKRIPAWVWWTIMVGIPVALGAAETISRLCGNKDGVLVPTARGLAGSFKGRAAKKPAARKKAPKGLDCNGGGGF